MRSRNFSRPVLWKWSAFVVLIAAAVLLARWKPAPRPLKVELLPIADASPAWDATYPSVVISLTTDSARAELTSSISIIKPTVRHDAPVNQFEVALDSGMFKLRQTDIFIGDSMPLSLTRTYRPWDRHSRAFGVGGNHPYDICPTGTRFPYTYQYLNLEDGREIYFPRISKGTRYEDAVFRNGNQGSEFYDARDSWNGDGWTLKFPDGGQIIFPEAYFAKNFAQGAPTEMRDAAGNRVQLKRDKVRNLQQLISASGHTITFQYDNADRIIEGRDDSGTIRRYEYGIGGQVVTVSDATHLLYRFEYQNLVRESGYEPYLLTAVIHDGKVLLRNEYADGSRVSRQILANGEIYHYEYLLDRTHNVTETTVTEPSGGVKRFHFKDGMLSEER